MHIKDEEDIDDISLHLKKARSNFKSRDTNTDKLLTLISNSSVKRPLLSSSKKSVDSLATMISIQKQNMLYQQQPHLHNKCDNETYGDMDAEENEQNDVEQREDSVVGFCDASTLSSSSRSPVVNEPISFASSSSNAVFGITYYSITTHYGDSKEKFYKFQEHWLPPNWTNSHQTCTTSFVLRFFF